MKISVSLSKPQLSKLLKGRVFQMKYKQLLGGPHVLNLHHENMKKVEKAKKKKSGVRLQLSDNEIILSGSGIKDVFKKGIRLAKNVINSDLYQQNLKPLVHKAADLGVDYLVPAQFAPAAKKAVSLLERKTGLGLKKRGRPSKKSKKSRVSKVAMCEQAGDFSNRRKNLNGGSFRAV